MFHRLASQDLNTKSFPLWASRLQNSLRLLLIPVLAAAALPAGAAQVNAPIVTSLISTTKHMISYRHQEHSWQTADGGLHLLMNRGEQAADDALALYSSYDDGLSWNLKASIPKTGEYSVSDGSFGNDTLNLTFSSNLGDVRSMVLKYDSVARVWTPRGVHKVPRLGKNVHAFNPSLVIDRNKNAWIALVQTDLESGDSVIRLYRRAAESVDWLDTGLNFGPRDALSVYPKVKRSARLVLTPAGIGLIYTVRDQMFWAERPSDGPADLPWTPRVEPLYSSPYPPDQEPMASHFSTVVDDKGYIHMAMADGGQLFYQRYDAALQAWGAPRQLTNTEQKIAYSQITWIGGAKIAIVANFDAMARVFQAADRGQSGAFSCTQRLEHEPAPSGSDLDYSQPRIEVPSKSRAPVPVFQQFMSQGGALQHAMLYHFDAAAAAACQ